MESISKTYQRKDIRREIVIDARVYFDGNGILSRVKNLSKGGACVTLPFPAAHYRPMVITAIDIVGVGYFSATSRWTSDFLVGLKFNNNSEASRQVTRFFDDLDRGTAKPSRPSFL